MSELNEVSCLSWIVFSFFFSYNQSERRQLLAGCRSSKKKEIELIKLKEQLIIS